VGDSKGIPPKSAIEGRLARHGQDSHGDVLGRDLATEICLNVAFLIDVMGGVPWVPWVVING
jgi:hypothetical protein